MVSERRRSTVRSHGITAVVASLATVAALAGIGLVNAGADDAGRSARQVATTVPVTPDVANLQSQVIGNVRRFSVTATVFEQQIATFPERVAQVWGYQDNLSSTPPSTPGPTAIAYTGETVEFTVRNDLPEPTTVHFHGLHAPNDADGVAGISQSPIPPGGVFTYRFTPGHAGNFAYHAHTDDGKQEMKGLDASFQVLDRTVRERDQVARDYVFTLQEFFFKEDGQPVDPMPPGGEFNFFTVNGKTRDAASDVPARVGERVRVRLYNASNDVHSMHLHGADMVIVSQNGHPEPRETVTTVDIGPGNFFEVELTFDKPGRWTFHCHFPHHTGNDMQSGPEGSPVGMTRVFDVTA